MVGDRCQDGRGCAETGVGRRATGWTNPQITEISEILRTDDGELSTDFTDYSDFTNGKRGNGPQIHLTDYTD